MSVPDFQTFMLPVLRLAAEGESKVRDVSDRISNEFDLSAEERAEILPSGHQTRIANRIHWAVTYLVKAGLLERPRRGHFAITDQGRKVLAATPGRIDIPFLSQFEAFGECRGRSNGEESVAVEPMPALASGTLDERVDAAFDDLNSALRTELLERILAMDPSAFEKLIIDLMLGMGYGGGGSGQHVGRTADGGHRRRDQRGYSGP